MHPLITVGISVVAAFSIAIRYHLEFHTGITSDLHVREVRHSYLTNSVFASWEMQ